MKAKDFLKGIATSNLGFPIEPLVLGIKPFYPNFFSGFSILGVLVPQFFQNGNFHV